MGKVYTYTEGSQVLDENTPLVTKEELLAVCKEVDEETPDTDINLFITGAHLIVCESIDGYGVSSARLALVERYLCAHLAAVTYAPSAFEAVGKVQVSYSTKVALNLDLTRYGQQAKLFDPTGQLKNLNDGKACKRFSITWGGLDKKNTVSGGGAYADTSEN